MTWVYYKHPSSISLSNNLERAKRELGMSDTILAYLAGLFDGEGSIVLTSRNKKDKKGIYRKTYVLYASMSNTDKSALQLLKASLGGSLYLHNKKQSQVGIKANYKTYSWVVSNTLAYFAIKALIPYLVIKREEAEEAIAYIERNLQKGAVARTQARWNNYDVYDQIKLEMSVDAESTQKRIREIRDSKRERICDGIT